MRFSCGGCVVQHRPNFDSGAELAFPRIRVDGASLRSLLMRNPVIAPAPVLPIGTTVQLRLDAECFNVSAMREAVVRAVSIGRSSGSPPIAVCPDSLLAYVRSEQAAGRVQETSSVVPLQVFVYAGCAVWCLPSMISPAFASFGQRLTPVEVLLPAVLVVQPDDALGIRISLVKHAASSNGGGPSSPLALQVEVRATAAPAASTSSSQSGGPGAGRDALDTLLDSVMPAPPPEWEVLASTSPTTTTSSTSPTNEFVGLAPAEAPAWKVVARTILTVVNAAAGESIAATEQAWRDVLARLSVEPARRLSQRWYQQAEAHQLSISSYISTPSGAMVLPRSRPTSPSGGSPQPQRHQQQAVLSPPEPPSLPPNPVRHEVLAMLPQATASAESSASTTPTLSGGASPRDQLGDLGDAAAAGSTALHSPLLPLSLPSTLPDGTTAAAATRGPSASASTQQHRTIGPPMPQIGSSARHIDGNDVSAKDASAAVAGSGAVAAAGGGGGMYDDFTTTSPPPPSPTLVPLPPLTSDVVAAPGGALLLSPSAVRTSVQLAALTPLPSETQMQHALDSGPSRPSRKAPSAGLAATSPADAAAALARAQSRVDAALSSLCCVPLPGASLKSATVSAAMMQCFPSRGDDAIVTLRLLSPSAADEADVLAAVQEAERALAGAGAGLGDAAMQLMDAASSLISSVLAGYAAAGRPAAADAFLKQVLDDYCSTSSGPTPRRVCPQPEAFAAVVLAYGGSGDMVSAAEAAVRFRDMSLQRGGLREFSASIAAAVEGALVAALGAAGFAGEAAAGLLAARSITNSQRPALAAALVVGLSASSGGAAEAVERCEAAILSLVRADEAALETLTSGVQFGDVAAFSSMSLPALIRAYVSCGRSGAAVRLGVAVLDATVCALDALWDSAIASPVFGSSFSGAAIGAAPSWRDSATGARLVAALQQWQQQQTPSPAAGLSTVDAACDAICAGLRNNTARLASVLQAARLTTASARVVAELTQSLVGYAASSEMLASLLLAHARGFEAGGDVNAAEALVSVHHALCRAVRELASCAGLPAVPCNSDALFQVQLRIGWVGGTRSLRAATASATSSALERLERQLCGMTSIATALVHVYSKAGQAVGNLPLLQALLRMSGGATPGSAPGQPPVAQDGNDSLLARSSVSAAGVHWHESVLCSLIEASVRAADVHEAASIVSDIRAAYASGESRAQSRPSAAGASPSLARAPSARAGGERGSRALLALHAALLPSGAGSENLAVSADRALAGQVSRQLQLEAAGNFPAPTVLPASFWASCIAAAATADEPGALLQTATASVSSVTAFSGSVSMLLPTPQMYAACLRSGTHIGAAQTAEINDAVAVLATSDAQQRRRLATAVSRLWPSASVHVAPFLGPARSPLKAGNNAGGEGASSSSSSSPISGKLPWGVPYSQRAFIAAERITGMVSHDLVQDAMQLLREVEAAVPEAATRADANNEGPVTTLASHLALRGEMSLQSLLSAYGASFAALLAHGDVQSAFHCAIACEGSRAIAATTASTPADSTAASAAETHCSVILSMLAVILDHAAAAAAPFSSPSSTLLSEVYARARTVVRRRVGVTSPLPSSTSSEGRPHLSLSPEVARLLLGEEWCTAAAADGGALGGGGGEDGGASISARVLPGIVLPTAAAAIRPQAAHPLRRVAVFVKEAASQGGERKVLLRVVDDCAAPYNAVLRAIAAGRPGLPVTTGGILGHMLEDGVAPDSSTVIALCAAVSATGQSGGRLVDVLATACQAMMETCVGVLSAVASILGSEDVLRAALTVAAVEGRADLVAALWSRHLALRGDAVDLLQHHLPLLEAAGGALSAASLLTHEAHCSATSLAAVNAGTTSRVISTTAASARKAGTRSIFASGPASRAWRMPSPDAAILTLCDTWSRKGGDSSAGVAPAHLPTLRMAIAVGTSLHTAGRSAAARALLSLLAEEWTAQLLQQQQQQQQRRQPFQLAYASLVHASEFFALVQGLAAAGLTADLRLLQRTALSVNSGISSSGGGGGGSADSGDSMGLCAGRELAELVVHAAWSAAMAARNDAAGAAASLAELASGGTTPSSNTASSSSIHKATLFDVSTAILGRPAAAAAVVVGNVASGASQSQEYTPVFLAGRQLAFNLRVAFLIGTGALREALELYLRDAAAPSATRATVVQPFPETVTLLLQAIAADVGFTGASLCGLSLPEELLQQQQQQPLQGAQPVSADGGRLSRTHSQPAFHVRDASGFLRVVQRVLAVAREHGLHPREPDVAAVVELHAASGSMRLVLADIGAAPSPLLYAAALRGCVRCAGAELPEVEMLARRMREDGIVCDDAAAEAAGVGRAVSALGARHFIDLHPTFSMRPSSPPAPSSSRWTNTASMDRLIASPPAAVSYVLGRVAALLELELIRLQQSSQTECRVSSLLASRPVSPAGLDMLRSLRSSATQQLQLHEGQRLDDADQPRPWDTASSVATATATASAAEAAVENGIYAPPSRTSFSEATSGAVPAAVNFGHRSRDDRSELHHYKARTAAVLHALKSASAVADATYGGASIVTSNGTVLHPLEAASASPAAINDVDPSRAGALPLRPAEPGPPLVAASAGQPTLASAGFEVFNRMGDSGPPQQQHSWVLKPSAEQQRSYALADVVSPALHQGAVGGPRTGGQHVTSSLLSQLLREEGWQLEAPAARRYARGEEGFTGEFYSGESPPLAPIASTHEAEAEGTASVPPIGEASSVGGAGALDADALLQYKVPWRLQFAPHASPGPHRPRHRSPNSAHSSRYSSSRSGDGGGVGAASAGEQVVALLASSAAPPPTLELAHANSAMDATLAEVGSRLRLSQLTTQLEAAVGIAHAEAAAAEVEAATAIAALMRTEAQLNTTLSHEDAVRVAAVALGVSGEQVQQQQQPQQYHHAGDEVVGVGAIRGGSPTQRGALSPPPPAKSQGGHDTPFHDALAALRRGVASATSSLPHSLAAISRRSTSATPPLLRSSLSSSSSSSNNVGGEHATPGVRGEGRPRAASSSSSLALLPRRFGLNSKARAAAAAAHTAWLVAALRALRREEATLTTRVRGGHVSDGTATSQSRPVDATSYSSTTAATAPRLHAQYTEAVARLEDISARLTATAGRDDAAAEALEERVHRVHDASGVARLQQMPQHQHHHHHHHRAPQRRRSGSIAGVEGAVAALSSANLSAAARALRRANIAVVDAAAADANAAAATATALSDVEKQLLSRVESLRSRVFSLQEALHSATSSAARAPRRASSASPLSRALTAALPPSHNAAWDGDADADAMQAALLRLTLRMDEVARGGEGEQRAAEGLVARARARFEEALAAAVSRADADQHAALEAARAAGAAAAAQAGARDLAAVQAVLASRASAEEENARREGEARALARANATVQNTVRPTERTEAARAARGTASARRAALETACAAESRALSSLLETSSRLDAPLAEMRAAASAAGASATAPAAGASSDGSDGAASAWLQLAQSLGLDATADVLPQLERLADGLSGSASASASPHTSDASSERVAADPPLSLAASLASRSRLCAAYEAELARLGVRALAPGGSPASFSLQPQPRRPEVNPPAPRALPWILSSASGSPSTSGLAAAVASSLSSSASASPLRAPPRFMAPTLSSVVASPTAGVTPGGSSSNGLRTPGAGVSDLELMALLENARRGARR